MKTDTQLLSTHIYLSSDETKQAIMAYLKTKDIEIKNDYLITMNGTFLQEITTEIVVLDHKQNNILTPLGVEQDS